MQSWTKVHPKNKRRKYYYCRYAIDGDHKQTKRLKRSMYDAVAKYCLTGTIPEGQNAIKLKNNIPTFMAMVNQNPMKAEKFTKIQHQIRQSQVKGLKNKKSEKKTMARSKAAAVAAVIGGAGAAAFALGRHLQDKELQVKEIQDKELQDKELQDKELQIIVEETLPEQFIPKFIQSSINKQMESNELIKHFQKDCEQSESLNPILVNKSKNVLRVATYNVHYWTDPNHKPTFNVIMDVVQMLDADVVCLQEVNISPSIFTKINTETYLRDTLNYQVCFCQASNHYGAPFGNILAVKKGLEILNVQNIVLPDKEKPAYKCGIIGEVKGLGLVASIHLDVHDHLGETRMLQVNMLHKYFSDKYPHKEVLICGDFNAVYKNDYNHKRWKMFAETDKARGLTAPENTTITTMIKNKRFVDSFRALNIPVPDYTAWTGRRVDYIFGTKNILQSLVRTNVVFSSASDHIPVFADFVRSDDKIVNYDQFKNIQNAKHLGGSNEKYTGFLDEVKYVIKRAKLPSIAANEVLTGKLYELVGLNVPALMLVKRESDNSYWIASEFSELYKGCENNNKVCKKLKNNPGQISGVLEGFLIDCWLANWDIIGLDYDNIGCKTETCNVATRIDVGGGLLYRALGTPKGSRFGRVPTEHMYFRDKKNNPQASKVFGHINMDNIEKGKFLLSNVSNAIVKATVSKFLPILQQDPNTKSEDLADILIARKDYLLKFEKFNIS